MEKKIRNLMSAVVPVVAVALIGCQSQVNYLKARNELNNGVRAFASANYVGAVASFDQAIEHDPELLDARSYRAYCYMMQIIPGGESDENMRVAEQALEGFQDVLDRDPNNQLALSSIASVYFKPSRTSRRLGKPTARSSRSTPRAKRPTTRSVSSTGPKATSPVSKFAPA